MEEARPILEQLSQEYELESDEDSLALLHQVWESLGGMDRWGPDPDREAWELATFVPKGNVFTQ
jgi:hypothetical protein